MADEIVFFDNTWNLAWKTSAIVHGILYISIAWMVFGKPTHSTDVPFTIYESPKLSSQAPQISKPKTIPKEKSKPKGVFGVSRRSITSVQKDAPEIKAGNTLAKEQDTKKLQASDQDSIPIPTDEVLVTRMPELITEMKIPYPPEAKQKGTQGAVVMDILIDHKGSVREAVLITGPGNGLNEAALEAVKKFTFSPAFMQDKPVAVRIRYAYRFVLER